MKSVEQRRSSYEWGILWMLLSAAFLSVSFLFLKISLDYIEYFFLIFLRFFIPLVFILIILTVRWEWKELISSTHFSLQLLRALCVLVSQYALAYYIIKNTLLNATVLINAGPLFIPLIEWAFLDRRPGKSTVVGALISFLGVLLILHPDRSLFSALSLVGLLAAVGQAGSQVLYGLKPKSENLLSSLFYLFFLTSVVAGIIVGWKALNGETVLTQKSSFAVEWAVFISVILMAFGTLLNQYYRGLAYRCGSPSTLSTFLYFSVFVSALFDWLIFQKIPTALTIIGSCLIILGGVLKIVLRAHILKKRNK